MGDDARRTREALIERYMSTLHGCGDLDEVQDWPISRYVGKFPDGVWEFIETVAGTKREAYRRAATLQVEDAVNPYCIWDQREG